MNRSVVCLLVLSLLLVGGCIILPVPVGHNTVGKEISDEDLAFIELGVTTKTEIVERLGEPKSFFEEHNLFYYFWYTRTEFLMAVPAFPVSSGPSTWSLLTPYAVYVQFDSDDHVKRFQRVQVPARGLSIKEWLESE